MTTVRRVKLNESGEYTEDVVKRYKSKKLEYVATLTATQWDCDMKKISSGYLLTPRFDRPTWQLLVSEN